MWNPEYPIKKLPKRIRRYFRELADCLYADLKEHKLTVVLIPAPEQKYAGHMVRCVENANPKWYSKLYCQHENFRRDNSLSSLDRIRQLQDQPSFFFRRGAVPYPFTYDELYRSEIKDMLVNGYKTEYWRIGPNKSIADYFQNDK